MSPTFRGIGRFGRGRYSTAMREEALRWSARLWSLVTILVTTTRTVAEQPQIIGYSISPKFVDLTVEQSFAMAFLHWLHFEWPALFTAIMSTVIVLTAFVWYLALRLFARLGGDASPAYRYYVQEACDGDANTWRATPHSESSSASRGEMFKMKKHTRENGYSHLPTRPSPWHRER